MLTGKALMSRREFWHKHLFLKQMLPCQSAEEKPVEMEQWLILGTRRDRAMLEGFQSATQTMILKADGKKRKKS